ncbi:MAG: restriction endonuclease [Anaerolineae bacterium]|nr:restriction endonuclease [Anaerolineae bacterium]
MKSDLPNSSQFSPIQTPLPELLLVVQANQPEREKIRDAIGKAFFTDRKDSLKLANNTILAMSEYGLLYKPREDQAHASLTEIGRTLAEFAVKGNLEELYGSFARHILLNLRGLDLLNCVEDLISAGQQPTKLLLVKELRRRGIYHPPNGTHANGMRQWLEQAGTVNGWVPNTERIELLLGGISSAEIDLYAALTPTQRAFAKAFARLDQDVALSNKVAAYATQLYGVEFPEGGLPQSTLFALRDIGLIECEKTTSGQGAKPYIVRPTIKLRNEYLEPILNAVEQSVGSQYRTLIRMPFSQILVGLKSDSRHEKGLALEALAFYLGRLLMLDFVQWRLRSAQTGGAELDVIMENRNLVFSRWQIQCKNSNQATLEDIAREVGIAQVIKSNVILIITTGRIGAAAIRFAETVMRETNLYIALLNGQDLNRINSNPSDIMEILSQQAEGAMKLKRPQINL